MECLPSRTIRLLLCPTAGDFTHERNVLAERAVPKLRELAAAHGFELEAVDLWQSLAEDDGQTHEGHNLFAANLAAAASAATVAGSTALSVALVLLGQKLGSPLLPKSIPVDDFDALTAAAPDADAKHHLNSWYERDDNISPPSYVMLPLSEKLPGFYATESLPSNKVTRERARRDWKEQSASMASALAEAAEKAFASDASRRQRYTMSRIEQAVEQTLQTKPLTIVSACRSFANINYEDAGAASHTDVVGGDSPTANAQAQEKLETLKKRVAEHVEPANALSYDLPWAKDGFDPSTHKHELYLSRMCQDVEAVLKRIIAAHATGAGAPDSDAAATGQDESARHNALMQGFAKEARGVDAAVADILASRAEPTVVVGPEGSGKTTLMASAAAKAAADGATAIVRFVGATSASRDEYTLLRSICDELHVKLKGGPRPAPRNKPYAALVSDFHRLLQDGGGKQIVVIVDGIDTLEIVPHLSLLHAWMPAAALAWPARIRFSFTSTKSDIYTAVVAGYADVHEVQPPTLDLDASRKIFADSVKAWNRTTTDLQRESLDTACKSSKPPMFVKLAAGLATLWKSAELSQRIKLPEKIKDLVDMVLDKLEKLHGKTTVARTLPLFALAPAGLSFCELLDVLSCDDELLEHELVSRGLALRRMPPMTVAALMRSLASTLLHQVEDAGFATWALRHSFFRSQILFRYAREDAAQQAFHGLLADFFAGRWGDSAKKPFKDVMNGGKTAVADRFCPSQKIVYETGPRIVLNGRPLRHLPRHLAGSGQSGELENSVLYNYEFLKARMTCVSVFAVLADFELPSAVSVTTMVRDALRLSADVLTTDPDQLAGQLLGRLRSASVDSKEDKARPRIEELLDECISRSIHASSFNTIPEHRCLVGLDAKLQAQFSHHFGDILGVACSATGDVIASCGSDGLVTVWKRDGQRPQSVYRMPGCLAVAVSESGERVLAASASALAVWEPNDGNSAEPVVSVASLDAAVVSVCLARDGMTAYVLLASGQAEVWALSGKQGSKTKEWAAFGGAAVGDGARAAIVLVDDQHVAVGMSGGPAGIWSKSGTSVASFPAAASNHLLVPLGGGRAAVPDGSAWAVLGGEADNADVRVPSAVGQLDTLVATQRAAGAEWMVATFASGLAAVYNLGAADSESPLALAWTLQTPYNLRTSSGRGVAAVADDGVVVASRGGNALTLWKQNQGANRQARLAAKHVGVQSLATDEEHHLAALASPSAVSLWDLGSGQNIDYFDLEVGGSRTEVSLTSDGKYAAVGKGCNGFAVLNISDKAFESPPMPLPAAAVAAETEGGGNGGGDENDGAGSGEAASSSAAPESVSPPAVTRVAVMQLSGPGEAMVVAAHADGRIGVWDLRRGVLLQTLAGHSGGVDDICPLRGSAVLASIGKDSHVRLWDVITGECQAAWPVSLEDRGVLAATEEGDALAAATGTEVSLWQSVKADAVPIVLRGHKNTVTAIALCGTRLISGSETELLVWNVSHQQIQSRLEGHTAAITMVRMCDADLCVSVAQDNTVRVWDSAKGDALSVFTGDSPVVDVSMPSAQVAKNSKKRFFSVTFAGGAVTQLSLPARARERIKSSGISIFGASGSPDAGMLAAMRSKLHKPVAPPVLPKPTNAASEDAPDIVLPSQLRKKNSDDRLSNTAGSEGSASPSKRTSALSAGDASSIGTTSYRTSLALSDGEGGPGDDRSAVSDMSAIAEGSEAGDERAASVAGESAASPAGSPLPPQDGAAASADGSNPEEKACCTIL